MKSLMSVVAVVVCALACAGGPDGQVGKKAGVVNGRAVDFAGNPLVDAEIVILGTTFAGGEKVSFYPRTGTDGTYSMEVPDGNYSVSGRHAVTFDGKRFTLDLLPGDGKRGKSYPSKEGITQNFTLPISGLRPDGDTRPDVGYSYYGGQSDFRVDDIAGESLQTNHFATEFPQGLTVKVTLTPDGALLDGSQGQPVTFEERVATMYDASFNGINIPLGNYTVTAEAVKPSGETRVLQVVQVGPYGTNRLPAPAPSASFKFQPDTTGVRTMNVGFLYGAPYPAP